jgi:hypothetical protein
MDTQVMIPVIGILVIHSTEAVEEDEAVVAEEVEDEAVVAMHNKQIPLVQQMLKARQ